MLVLADFLDSLLRAAVLASLSLVLGSVAWSLWVLRAPQGRAPTRTLGRCLTLLVTDLHGEPRRTGRDGLRIPRDGALLAIALVLVFYREANVLLPPE